MRSWLKEYGACKWTQVQTMYNAPSEQFWALFMELVIELLCWVVLFLLIRHWGKKLLEWK
jgi:hypothetical protein